MPYVAQVAVGRRARLAVFGADYDTPDGTGVRDYIHVVDLAQGHVAALNRLLSTPGSLLVNLGTGRGYSVLELIAAYEKASGKPVPYDIVARRPGDIDSCYADPALALSELGWQATRDLAAMCADSWRWLAMNPNGFDGAAPDAGAFVRPAKIPAAPARQRRRRVRLRRHAHRPRPHGAVPRPGLRPSSASPRRFAALALTGLGYLLRRVAIDEFKRRVLRRLVAGVPAERTARAEPARGACSRRDNCGLALAHRMASRARTPRWCS